MKRALIASSIATVLVLAELMGVTLPASNSSASAAATTIGATVPVTEMPFEMVGTGHVFVRVLINGTPGWFILDTANHGMSVDTEFGRRAGLNLQGGYVASGGGPEMVQAAVATNVSLGLPGLTLDHQRLVAIPLEPMAPLLGRDFDGILGSDLFDRFVVEVDYAAKRIRLHNPESFRHTGAGEILPTRLDENSFPYVKVKLTFPGKEELEAEFLIDSAADFAVSVQKPFATVHGIPGPGAKKLLERGTSVGGSYEILTSRASKVQIGRWAFQDPLIDFSQAATGGMASNDRAGLIGGQLLRRFRVTFDNRRHQLILEPNSNFADPFEADMSGVRLRAEGARFETLRIRRVLGDSPASDAGLEAGDIIVMVNGEPASTFSADGLRGMFRRPGTHRLTVTRRAARIDVILKLRRLI
jgi:hypothetical protein